MASGVVAVGSEVARADGIVTGAVTVGVGSDLAGLVTGETVPGLGGVSGIGPGWVAVAGEVGRGVTVELATWGTDVAAGVDGTVATGTRRGLGGEGAGFVAGGGVDPDDRRTGAVARTITAIGVEGGAATVGVTRLSAAPVGATSRRGIASRVVAASPTNNTDGATAAVSGGDVGSGAAVAAAMTVPRGVRRVDEPAPASITTNLRNAPRVAITATAPKIGPSVAVREGEQRRRDVAMGVPLATDEYWDGDGMPGDVGSQDRMPTFVVPSDGGRRRPVQSPQMRGRGHVPPRS